MYLHHVITHIVIREPADYVKFLYGYDGVNELPAEVQDIYAVKVSIILIPLHQGSFYNTSS